jgi:hypothetical protein
MMYIRDEVVDEIVARHETLQNVVQGRTVMVWRPGQTAALATMGCLMFGWAGTSLSLFWLATPSVKTFAYCVVAAFVVAAPMNLFNYRVVRGAPRARTYMYRFSVAMVGASSLALIACVIGLNKVAIVMAAVGVALNLIAAKLIAGHGYALLSATFRAQREYAERVKQPAR